MRQKPHIPAILALATFGLACLLAGHADARTLEVGPSRDLKAPSAAAKIAQDGDTIEIDPGEYFDCAAWRANGLTIAGTGPGVVITDLTCAGKALFIVDGADTTIRDLTFTRARVGDGNGAGIRQEGRNLTIEHSRFINNQTGILAGENPASTIRIVDSEFVDNGACSGQACVGAILIGGIAHLSIERSTVRQTKGGHQITSDAALTELIGNRIEDGPAGTSSFLVQFGADGRLLMQDNILEKGPNTTNPRAAIMIGGGWGSAQALEFRRNRFQNDMGHSGTFILNWTGTDPVLNGNIVGPDDTELSSRWLWLQRLRYCAVTAKDAARHWAGSIKRGLSTAIHWI
jgi:hypothetical protein